MNAHSSIVGSGLPGAAGAMLPEPQAARNVNDPTKPLTAASLLSLFGGQPSTAGVMVNERRALGLSAVWACVNVVSSAIARMPLLVFRRTEEGRERASDHPLWPLLTLRPHRNTSAFYFRQSLVAARLLWGNGYAEIVRRGDGQVQELVVIEPWRVSPFVAAGELRYRVSMRDGKQETLQSRDIIHLPGLNFDGLVGLSVIQHAKQMLGTAIAREECRGRLFGQGLRSSGFLSHPGKLGAQGIQNLRESFTGMYAGPENAWKPMVLEEGMTWSQTTIPPDDAQMIESDYLSIEDICRFFGVPPHKVQHLLRATNNNIEQQSLDFLGDTLQPITEALEQELNYKLLSPAERGDVYVEHLTQAIVQMDSVARGTLYEKLSRIGAMSPDDIRDRENLNRLPDARGSVYTIPSSQMPAPTPAQADQLLEAWVSKTSKGGTPAPAPDGKVGGSGQSA